MSDPLVLVLLGGDEAEAAVSRLSGAAVADALREAGRRVRVHDLPRADAASLAEAIDAGPVDVVFPVLHGPWGEGGPLQDLLAGRGLPFVGCDAAAARRCMDKQQAKQLAAAAGVPVIEGGVVQAGDPSPVPPPAVVKPVDDGSSVDLWMAEDDESLEQAIAAVTARRGRALVERRVRGREITVGLLEGEPLPVIEIVPAAGPYDYQAKYERADTQYRVAPVDLPAEVVAAASDAARRVWDAVGARDLARVDFLVDAGVPRMLEINTMPGFTARSLLPRAARAAGYDLPRLAARLVDLAAARGGP
jgi:D-alanine-D-alanine ligase